MRTWNLLSGVGVAIVAAWLAVTNLAYASEFTCEIPRFGDTDCGFPKITIPARGVLVVQVYTIQKDGKDTGDPVKFRILDTNKNNVQVHELTVSARSTSSWMYESNEAALVAQIRVNHADWSKIVVRGRYTIK